MSQCQYSLSWEEHEKNICNGLSYLQQNGEFVDMTVAADGHLVKVHQVIMALSSSYFKDLIASANCPHPVIVLNKISHTTLTAILEYIYTGQVLISIEDIKDLIDAAKELHIKGLQDMDLSVTKQMNLSKSKESMFTTDISYVNLEDTNISYYDIHRQTDIDSKADLDNESQNETVTHSYTCDRDSLNEILEDDATVLSTLHTEVRTLPVLSSMKPEKTSTLLYTISTHGALQLILNRFLYYLKHTRLDQSRQWRCVDYVGSQKCPAVVTTRDNMVLQRYISIRHRIILRYLSFTLYNLTLIKAHKHPFHDKKILKKVQNNNVFSELVEAVQSGATLKGNDRARQKDYAMESE